MIAKVFHVLRWTKRELERAVAALLEDGTVLEVEIEGLKGMRLVSARTLH